MRKNTNDTGYYAYEINQAQLTQDLSLSSSSIQRVKKAEQTVIEGKRKVTQGWDVREVGRGWPKDRELQEE